MFNYIYFHMDRMDMHLTKTDKIPNNAGETSDRKKEDQSAGPKANNLKRVREQLLISKAELARKAGVSPLTIDRIEKGLSCRMETMRKIILALGYTLDDKDKIFPNYT